MSDCNRYVICYPGGSGGSFVAAALSSIKHKKKFNVDQLLGHCHGQSNLISNFFHGDTNRSFQEELTVIQSLNFIKNDILNGHCRNIVALKEAIITQLGYNELEKTKFIKVSVDHQNFNEILFVATMLKRKVNCYSELSFDEYLEQTTNYIKSWYWIENAYTIPYTITFTLSEVFLGKISSKLDLSQEEVNKIDQFQDEYLTVQRRLHKDLIELL
jgi:hypothetical protein